MTIRHYILTRAVYDPDQWSEDANRKRLDLFDAITVSAMGAMSSVPGIPIYWILALHPHDPNINIRIEYARDAARLAGFGFDFLEVDTQAADRLQTAYKAYGAPWRQVMEDGTALTTRLDDDDALTPDYLPRLYEARQPEDAGKRVAYIFPTGIRIHNGRYTTVRHKTNGMATLETPSGDEATIYSHPHRKLYLFVDVVNYPDSAPAWLWHRHPDALSGYHQAQDPIDESVLDMFPIDWRRIRTEPNGPPIPGGELIE